MRIASRPAEHRSLGVISRVVKRLLDIALATLLLVLAMPIMIVAALCVGLTSRGPILYSQQRCGRDGRPFKILKFRTMVSDADKIAHLAEVSAMKKTDAPIFKAVDDPRVTKVGRLLRRTSVDELPQLFNVLAGDMSLVGPRPIEPAEAASLEDEEARRRHSVRPGLTCLWQVLRDENTSFAERIHLDLLYVSNRTLSMDMALIAMTPVAILRGNGSF